jgi:hypothetical protein
LVLGFWGYLIGGVVAGYLIADDYYDGAINGAISSALSGLLVAFIVARIYGAYIPYTQYTTSGTTAILFGAVIFAIIQSIIVGLVLESLGGAAGVFVYEQIEIRNKQKLGITSRLDGNGYLVCSKCNTFHKLEPSESPEDFTNECECGGKFKFYNNIDWLNK